MDQQQRAWETRRITHAISIRQPWAELIIRGVKVREFGSVPTHIRGRIYVYAGLRTRPIHEYLEFGLKRADLPTGVLIGTVDVVDCEQIYQHEDQDNRYARFAYLLAHPRRLTRPREPENHPQPIWFRPFGA
jgi:hypothetical protein